MKKQFIILLLAAVCLASCHTREKVLYFQDLNTTEAIQTQALKTLCLAPGDKIGVTVTSATTPELAMRYNLTQGTGSSSTQNADNQRYTIDENGNIDLLGVGRVQVSGLTRAQAATKIQEIFRNGFINDAVVTVAAYNQYINVLGEVAKPGRIEIKRDNLTILEAISMAGDLTIYGRRDMIRVLRQEGNATKTYFVDLRSKDIFNSPVYNLQQNDIIYVEPNRVKMGQSTNNDNTFRNVSVWITIASFLTTLGVVIWK